MDYTPCEIMELNLFLCAVRSMKYIIFHSVLPDSNEINGRVAAQLHILFGQQRVYETYTSRKIIIFL